MNADVSWFQGGGGSRVAEPRGTGVLPSQIIEKFIASNQICSSVPILPKQIQPASLDLRLGPLAYRVRASFLPGRNTTVEDRVRELVDLRSGAIFERRCVYVVPLLEQLFLPDDVSGKANPKSTTGRLDIFTRLITDYGTEFERVPPRYRSRLYAEPGRLYAEVAPRTFSIRVQQGMSLNQLRFVRGKPQALREDYTLGKRHEEDPLAFTPEDVPAESPRLISIDVGGSGPSEIIGYKAKDHAPLIDLALVNHYDPGEFWEPIRSTRKIILNPDDFYILVSKEKVRVPPDLAAEMVAHDPSHGEFRIHYAGFFDPGFGHEVEEGKGTTAVLEVRSHEVPFVLEDGQVVGRLVYERLLEVPDKIYGPKIGSSYQSQGLSLSKQFRRQS
jgi:dCTP deaminase